VPTVPVKLGLFLLVGWSAACAQTVSSGEDAASAHDVEASETNAGDAPPGDRPGECTRTDWRCFDTIDPGTRVVWVDQDVALPEIRGEYWEANRLRYGVRLSPYRIGRYEVTNEAYQACSSAGACPPPMRLTVREQPPEVPADYSTAPAYRFHPAVVNWFRARAVCRFLGGDLPNKAQWQFAANAGRAQGFPWSDEAQCVGNFSVIQIVGAPPPGDRLDCGSRRGTPRMLPVDSSPEARGPFGSFNLLGNVAEFVYSDLENGWNAMIRRRNDAGEFPLDPPPATEPFSGVRTGGGWVSVSQVTFAASSVSTQPDAALNVDGGVRCVWH
jgi:formylglycine-generating enzyme required for sulfatase activity